MFSPERMESRLKNRIRFYEKDSIEILFACSEHTFPLHSHECFCFGVVEEGSVTFTINGAEKTLRPGMAFIVPSNVGVLIQAEGRYRYITICIKGKWKEQLKHLEFRDYFLTFPSSEEIHRLCADYIENSSAETFLNALLSLMQPAISGRAAECEEKADPVNAACGYIRAHAQEKFSLDALADAVHVSKYYLVKLFKKEMGVTPHQYYVQVKMHFVREKILDSQNEADVAMELEFNDQSHLCNLFKKQMGISLQDYKKNHKELS